MGLAERGRYTDTKMATILNSWKEIARIGVGGLTEIGFSDDEAFLLVVSWSLRPAVTSRFFGGPHHKPLPLVGGESGSRGWRHRCFARVNVRR